MKKETITAFFFLVIFLAALVAGGCTDTFLVQKNGWQYFLGSDSKDLHKWLCESGDLKAILADTQLPSTTKDYFYKYSCEAVGPSKEKIAGVYASMTPEQRQELRYAFQTHGYSINYHFC